MPELVHVDGVQPAFTFQLFASTRDSSESYHWLNHWYSPDGTIWLAFAKVEAGYLLRFPELADFIVSTDARSVCCYPRADIPLETIRHLLLNQVIPLVLSQLGGIVLHAAACAMPQGAIAFMGSTGAGKSIPACDCGRKVSLRSLKRSLCCSRWLIIRIRNDCLSNRANSMARFC